MSKKPSLDDILAGFNPINTSAARGAKSGTPLTLWVPLELKARYDLIQKTSGRKFSATIRELVEAAISIAEQRAS